MRTILNLIIAVLVFFLGCDIEKNSNVEVTNYSNSILCVAGIIFFGFFSIYWKQFINHLNKTK